MYQCIVYTYQCVWERYIYLHVSPVDTNVPTFQCSVSPNTLATSTGDPAVSTDSSGRQHHWHRYPYDFTTSGYRSPLRHTYFTVGKVCRIFALFSESTSLKRFVFDYCFSSALIHLVLNALRGQDLPRFVSRKRSNPVVYPVAIIFSFTNSLSAVISEFRNSWGGSGNVEPGHKKIRVAILAFFYITLALPGFPIYFCTLFRRYIYSTTPQTKIPHTKIICCLSFYPSLIHLPAAWDFITFPFPSPSSGSLRVSCCSSWKSNPISLPFPYLPPPRLKNRIFNSN